ncbi:hypothetical protein Naga_100086g28 [Nannochloropsis gaditana]|uniref:Uncharacterized protein n=1 Tax=Nannochloropsis gaditana TaxID=72520 RepID=W7TD78_9STRA|nr:hypothetical protein Naga_100086g28 [Nannochloropsis gaditana]
MASLIRLLNRRVTLCESPYSFVPWTPSSYYSHRPVGLLLPSSCQWTAFPRSLSSLRFESRVLQSFLSAMTVDFEKAFIKRGNVARLGNFFFPTPCRSPCKFPPLRFAAYQPELSDWGQFERKWSEREWHWPLFFFSSYVGSETGTRQRLL